MRSRNLFLLVYFLWICFGKSTFCTFLLLCVWQDKVKREIFLSHTKRLRPTMNMCWQQMYWMKRCISPVSTWSLFQQTRKPHEHLRRNTRVNNNKKTCQNGLFLNKFTLSALKIFRPQTLLHMYGVSIMSSICLVRRVLKSIVGCWVPYLSAVTSIWVTTTLDKTNESDSFYLCAVACSFFHWSSKAGQLHLLSKTIQKMLRIGFNINES